MHSLHAFVCNHSRDIFVLILPLSWKRLGFKTIFNSHFTTESKLLDLKRNDLRIAAGDCSCWGRERELSLSWAEIYQLRFLLFWQFGSIFTLIGQDRKQRNNLAKCSHLTWPPSPAEWSPTSVQLTQFTQNCCNWDFNLLLAYICMYACISLYLHIWIFLDTEFSSILIDIWIFGGMRTKT